MAGAARKITVEFLGKNSTDKTARQVEQRFGKLGAKLDRVGQRAGKVLAVGFAAAGAAAVKMGRDAGEDEAAASKLANTLRNAAHATDGQIASNEKWITAAGKAFGVADDDLRPALSRLAVATGSVAKAQKLASLAMDISAGTGKDLGAVSTALAKAQNGNVAGLARLGVKTKDAAGHTLSLDKITKNLATTYKGAAAKGAQTTAGKSKILAVQMQELQEQIGAKLLPVMQKLTDMGMKVVDWISRNTTTAGILLGVFGGLTAALWLSSVAMRAVATGTAIMTAAKKISAFWTNAEGAAFTRATVAAKAQAIALKLGAAAQWLLNAAMSANPLALVVIAIAALVAGLVIAYKKSETFRAIVHAAFHAVQAAASFAFNWVKSHWPLLLAIVTGPIGLAVLVIAKNWSKIKAGASSVVSHIKDKFNSVVSFFRGIPGRLSSAFSGAFNGLKNAFRAAVNFIIRGWYYLSFHIPSVNTHIPGVGKVGGMTISTPNIPMLAKGGDIRRAGSVVVGDAGPEVLDLPGGARVTPLSKAGGDVYNITVSGALDPTAVAAQIETMLTKRQRSLGRPLFA